MGTSVCEECKLNPWKYKCPGCSIRSCGLNCVKAHKKRTGCTGKRKLTDFVPLSKFDDNLLLSDYNMLEETKRVAECARRVRQRLCSNPYYFPYHVRLLQREAASRRTGVLFLPCGMLKREKNKSAYNKKSKCISWTIEWRFHSTDVVLVDNVVGEDTNLCSAIGNHLKPGPWIHKLKPFCDVDLNSLRLFIRKYPKGAKAPFKELDIKAPLRKQLSNVVILEYPVIHVYLPSHSFDFEIIRDFDRVTTTPPNPSSDSTHGDGQGIANGIPAREEEIEEDEDDIDSFEPKVFDFIKHMNCNPRQPQVEVDGVTNNSHSRVEPTEQEDIVAAGNMEIEFDQGLLDTYSVLFEDMNPDDYFNFECEFTKGFGSDDDEDIDLQQNLPDELNLDEPEDGEIVE